MTTQIEIDETTPDHITEIRVDGNLDLVMVTHGPGGSVGLMDRDLVRQHVEAVRRELIVAASERACSLTDISVGIAGGTLSYADFRDL